MSNRMALKGAIETAWTRDELNQIGPDDLATTIFRTLPSDATEASGKCIYVSKTDGDDSNSGLTKILPKKTIAQGLITLESDPAYKYIVILDSETYSEIISFGTLSYEPYSAASVSTWQDVTWATNLSKYIAVADSGAGGLMYSEDGREWTAISGFQYRWRGVTSSHFMTVAVGYANAGTPTTGQQIATTYDGTNWTLRTAPSTDSWQSVAYSTSLDLFVAVGVGGDTYKAMSSSNGITWTGRSTPATGSWNDVIWVPELELFVAVGYATNVVITSPDGITWTAQTPANTNYYTGVAWSPALQLLAAVSQDGTDRVMTSPDGINWTARTAAEANSWQSVAWVAGYGKFIAVSSDGTNRIMESEDGLTWTSASAPEANTWVSVYSSPENMSIVGLSTDGTNRVFSYGRDVKFIADEGQYPTLARPPYSFANYGQIATTSDRAVNDIILWENTLYTGTDNGIYYSSDGLTWSGPITGTSGKNIPQLAYNDNIPDRLYFINSTDSKLQYYDILTDAIVDKKTVADVPVTFGIISKDVGTFTVFYAIVGYDSANGTTGYTIYPDNINKSSTSSSIFTKEITNINKGNEATLVTTSNYLYKVSIYTSSQLYSSYGLSYKVVNNTEEHYSIYKYIDNNDNEIIYDSSEAGIYKYEENTVDSTNYLENRTKVLDKLIGYEFASILYYINDISLILGINNNGNLVYYHTNSPVNPLLLTTGDITPSCFIYYDNKILMGNSTPDGSTYYEIIELRDKFEISGIFHMEGFHVEQFYPTDVNNGGSLIFKYCSIEDMDTINNWRLVLHNNIINRNQYNGFPLICNSLDSRYNLLINTNIQYYHSQGNPAIFKNCITMNNSYTTALNILTSGEDDITPPTAAAYCKYISIGDKNDWYLPSIGEITELVTQAAAGNMPVQALIKTIEAGDLPLYWSSTESGTTGAEALVYTHIDGSYTSYGLNKATFTADVRPIRQFTATVGSYSVGDFGQAGWVFYEDSGTFLECAPARSEVSLSFSNYNSYIGTNGYTGYFEGDDATELIVNTEGSVVIFNNIFSNNFNDMNSQQSTTTIYNNMISKTTGNIIEINCSDSDPLLVDYQPADFARGFLKQSDAIALSAGCYLFDRSLDYSNRVDFRVNYNPNTTNIQYNPSNLISYISDSGEYYDSMDGYRRTWSLSWNSDTANSDWKTQRNKLLALNIYPNALYRWGDKDSDGNWVPLYDGTAITFADNVGTIDALDDDLPNMELQNHYINVASGYYHIESNDTNTITIDQDIPDGVYGEWSIDYIGVKVKKNNFSMNTPGHAYIDSHPYAGYKIELIESSQVIDEEINWAENMT